MQGNKILVPIHVPGTLAANIVVKFSAPFDLTLEQVQAVTSNASSAQIKVGTSADDAAYLAFKDTGDSGVPGEWSRADFAGGQYPHVSDGVIVVVTVDFDGASGTAAQNLTALLTFSEG